MKTFQIDIPDWTAEQIAAKSSDVGIKPSELIRALVCSNARGFDAVAQRSFTVPSSMQELFPSERFMVVGRQEDSVTLTPTDYVPFELALQSFQSNGLNEDEVMARLNQRWSRSECF